MTNSKKNIEIEYLRAFAILITIFAHLPFLMPYHEDFLGVVYFQLYAAWTGVDLFFCISGYVIAKSYADYFDQHREQGSFFFAFKCFWIKRVYRLLPSAWLWAIIVLVLCLTFNETGKFGSLYQNIRSITAIVTFTGNLANQSGLYLQPNDVYWSLALEEQFYFIFPLFLLFVTNPRTRIISLILLVILQFFINRNPFGSPLQGLLASFRLDAIMLGILIYYFSTSSAYKAFEPVSLRNSKLKTFFLTGLLVYLLGAVPGQMINMPIVVGMVAVISAILVLLASYRQQYIFSIPVLSGVLAWIGARSYGLYLIHVPAYRFTYEAWTRYLGAHGDQPGTQHTLGMILTALLVMFVAADLNYRFLEVPLRRRGAKIAGEKLAKAAENY